MSRPELAPLRFEKDGLVLRAYVPGDGAALSEAVCASYDHLRPWMPWARPDQSVDESEAICRRSAGRYLKGEDHMLGAWQGGRLVASTGFHLRVGAPELGNAEIGMWVRADGAGRGLGTRLLALMLEWGFGEWGWERLVWRCDTRNHASARVAEKNGLRLEGTFRSDSVDVEGARRDTAVYAILRSEWPAA